MIQSKQDVFWKFYFPIGIWTIAIIVYTITGYTMLISNISIYEKIIIISILIFCLIFSYFIWKNSK